MTTPHLNREQLSAWLDGVLELTPAQQVHRTECPECLRAIERLQGLRRVARQAIPAIPTDRMWREIEARVAGTQPGGYPAGGLARLAHAFTTYRLPIAGLGTAAAVLLVLVLARQAPEPARVSEVAPPVPTAVSAPAPAPTERRKEKKSEAPVPAAARDADFSKTASTSAPAAEPAPQPAPAPQVAPARALKASRAPAAAASSANEAAAPPVRVTWRGKAVVITADREEQPSPDQLRFTGHVLITPAVIGNPYLATVDALTRTLTGQTTASTAEIHLPEEALHLKP